MRTYLLNPNFLPLRIVLLSLEDGVRLIAHLIPVSIRSSQQSTFVVPEQYPLKLWGGISSKYLPLLGVDSTGRRDEMMKPKRRHQFLSPSKLLERGPTFRPAYFRLPVKCKTRALKDHDLPTFACRSSVRRARTLKDHDLRGFLKQLVL